jgi:hypothetical protein
MTGSSRCSASGPLRQALLELTGDPSFARRVGEDFVSALAGSANSSVLRSLGSPEALLRKRRRRDDHVKRRRDAPAAGGRAA